MKSSIRPTLIVRRIMAKYGKDLIYTNLYSTCRSVKCYKGNTVKDARMVNEIARSLSTAKVRDTEVRYTKNRTSWAGYTKHAGAIIIRLPL